MFKIYVLCVVGVVVVVAAAAVFVVVVYSFLYHFMWVLRKSFANFRSFTHFPEKNILLNDLENVGVFLLLLFFTQIVLFIEPH
jgi:hypothetical protein